MVAVFFCCSSLDYVAISAKQTEEFEIWWTMHSYESNLLQICSLNKKSVYDSISDKLALVGCQISSLVYPL